MPHDDRGYTRDIKALTYLSEQLTEKGLKHFLVSTPPGAQHIKGICSLFDAVISGRMHFDIAAVGQGKPVTVLIYQAKFSGLIQHFNLSDWLEISPDEAISLVYLKTKLTKSLSEFSCLQVVVEERRRIVVEMAEKTFG